MPLTDLYWFHPPVIGFEKVWPSIGKDRAFINRVISYFSVDCSFLFLCEFMVWISYQILYSNFWNSKGVTLVQHGLKKHSSVFPLVCSVTVDSVCGVDFAADICHCYLCRCWGFVVCDGVEFCWWFCCGCLFLKKYQCWRDLQNFSNRTPILWLSWK